jgi:uncharacterized membrane protein YfcA
VTTVLLFVAGLVGGALNAVAGGGSFIALPALLSAGVAPVAANATTTLALWPGSVSSAVAYRGEILTGRQWLVKLGVASLIGGVTGGWLLIRTPDQRFLRVLPWLMLTAATTFTVGGRLTDRLSQRRLRSASMPQPEVPRLQVSAGFGEARQSAEGATAASSGNEAPFWLFLFQLVIATYGGYFAGGMGIMMLAAFSVAGMTDIHEMNGIKSLLSVAINGVSLAVFIAAGRIAWTAGLVMVAGAVVGGYSAAFIARRINARVIRTFVIAVAWTMTIYFFVR